MPQYPVKPGYRYPMGAEPDAGGVNFSVFSRHATGMELLLFEAADSREPFQVIPLAAEINRTFFSWHVYVEGLRPGAFYNWRVAGPVGNEAETGYCFDDQKALLDPWARVVCDRLWDRARASRPGPNHDRAMRSVVVDMAYDWEGDTPLYLSSEQAIIYEVHVGGFTRHPSAGVAHPGTFAALMEKIPYLQELGITHVELLPVMAFDTQDVPATVAERGLCNYWGYSTHSFYAPHPGYCVEAGSCSQIREFRDMVKALHKAGIGVILDVVFNHTSEAGSAGPLVNFKGFSNNIFYHHDPSDRSLYLDYSGCGNSVNANHPLVSRFLLGSLQYWVKYMHVDGFRFDLASALSRGADGKPQYDAPILWNIEFSRTLARTSLIAEAWDAGGLYQVGGFPGYRWQEWNGRYRDVVRQFVRGDKGLVSELATRLCGSSDLYQAAGRLPINSINFITSHDGFTLYDLLSYNDKHNEANGEENRDGHEDNLSWNCGHEGATGDAEILALRRRQAKNFMAILLLSHGVPMLLAGDEILRSQQGNNNAYCQDNELSWFDWNLTRKNEEMLRFVRAMVAFRRRHPCLIRRRFVTENPTGENGLAGISWHGRQLHRPLWDDPETQVLAYTLAASEAGAAHLHIIINMAEQGDDFPLPAISGRSWYRAIDTGAAAPDDIVAVEQQVPVGEVCRVAGRSVVVLESRV